MTACTTCGTEPLESARFCHGCGAPVGVPDTPAEYKQVTVLFADVVRSMDIASAVGAERLREILADLVDRAKAIVQRYGGTLDKFTGDGIMAVFGAPVAMEDHAFHACMAALEIQDASQDLAAEVDRRDGVELRLRVGLNSGQVIAGEIGSASVGYTAIGEQVGDGATDGVRRCRRAGCSSASPPLDWLMLRRISANPSLFGSRVSTNRSQPDAFLAWGRRKVLSRVWSRVWSAGIGRLPPPRRC